MQAITIPVDRRLLAAAVVIQPALVAVNGWFHPAVDISGAGFLAGVVSGPNRWLAVHMVAALAGLLAVPAALGLRSLVARRGRRLANLGLLAATVGGAVLALTFAAEASVLHLAASSGIDQSAALRIADAYVSSPEFYAIPVGILATMLATVLLGAALLAARAVPVWQAGLYLVASLATFAGAPGSSIGFVTFGAAAAAAALLARHVARLPVDGAEARPVPAEPISA